MQVVLKLRKNRIILYMFMSYFIPYFMSVTIVQFRMTKLKVIERL